MPDESEKFFPNVIEEHVKPFMEGDNLQKLKNTHQSQGEKEKNREMSSESEEETSEKAELKRKNFLQAMHNGGIITDYHKNKRGNYTVHVKLPSNEVGTFANISGEHFNKFKTQVAKEIPGTELHHHREKFEKVMSEGGHIEDVVKFESYSVHVKMPEGNVEQFGNISKEYIDKYKDRIDLHPEIEYDKAIDHQHRKGDTFGACMERPGATIIGYHAHPFYSLHVKTSDNRMEYYSHISEKILEKYKRPEPQ
ncbi:11113_t:CDS:2 [Acaulospora colombiana]|uniref:11113_t:CDS:1 n=1 Tax=Acaulospora colombiana TaxID=27376 RepID=A0ACA9KJB5_9GLOM|nr:11113_t:CDS:2 [Acaulospora colombiana]